MRWEHLRPGDMVHLISRLRRQLPLIGEALGCADPKPPLPGEVARRSRDGEVAANLIQPLSQPAADSVPTPFVPSGHFPLIGGIGPWEGSLWGAFCGGGALLRPCFRQNQHKRAEQSPAPTGCEANNEIQCKKVQPDELRLHLLLMVNILRQLAANLAPRIRRRVARKVTIVWNDA